MEFSLGFTTCPSMSCTCSIKPCLPGTLFETYRIKSWSEHHTGLPGRLVTCTSGLHLEVTAVYETEMRSAYPCATWTPQKTSRRIDKHVSPEYMSCVCVWENNCTCSAVALSLPASASHFGKKFSRSAQQSRRTARHPNGGH